MSTDSAPPASNIQIPHDHPPLSVAMSAPATEMPSVERVGLWECIMVLCASDPSQAHRQLPSFLSCKSCQLLPGMRL